MDKWEYSYLIVLKTLWEKEKLLVTSNFSYSHNVFKSCLLFEHQNEYLWSKGFKYNGKSCLKEKKDLTERTFSFTKSRWRFPAVFNFREEGVSL